MDWIRKKLFNMMPSPRDQPTSLSYNTELPRKYLDLAPFNALSKLDFKFDRQGGFISTEQLRVLLNGLLNEQKVGARLFGGIDQVTKRVEGIELNAQNQRRLTCDTATILRSFKPAAKLDREISIQFMHVTDNPAVRNNNLWVVVFEVKSLLWDSNPNEPYYYYADSEHGLYYRLEETQVADQDDRQPRSATAESFKVVIPDVYRTKSAPPPSSNPNRGLKRCTSYVQIADSTILKFGNRIEPGISRYDISQHFKGAILSEETPISDFRDVITEYGISMLNNNVGLLMIGVVDDTLEVVGMPLNETQRTQYAANAVSIFKTFDPPAAIGVHYKMNFIPVIGAAKKKEERFVISIEIIRQSNPQTFGVPATDLRRPGTRSLASTFSKQASLQEEVDEF